MSGAFNTLYSQKNKSNLVEHSTNNSNFYVKKHFVYSIQFSYRKTPGLPSLWNFRFISVSISTNFL